ncbi:prolipoprotein diacylglyceryl transferase [Algoriphagus sp. A40]|uniref:prolipoprotein diacylglyceryl transferase n=1 Tax=Algoriphagus sp. A40 TaxID=1945863 RepID=UPI0009849C48|nr:prolipoprotein diacylglyceryl transferase [Algoriphagus sp. A40]OOG76192.1 prolipoprotein diacylglyceryl transferase [Algoriphagus sp. A40]
MAALSNLALLPLAINWNHDGGILDLGFYELRWYSLLFAFGFILSFFFLGKLFRKELVPMEKLDVLVVNVVVATVLGARLGHCIFYEFDYYSQHPLEILFPVRFSPYFEIIGFRGLASHGGAIGIFIAILIYCQNQQMKVFWVLDKLSLVIPLACAFIRLGNLFNSEMIGPPTSVPWAFVFQQIDNIPRHPGQVYEAIAYFSIFVFLNLFSKKSNRENGFIFGLFLVLMFLARFILEFFKIDQVSFESGMMLNMGQLLSLPFIIAGILLMAWKSKMDSPAHFPTPE